MTEQNEKRLLQRLKKADTAALEEIIELYTPYIYAIVSNVLSGALCEEDREEIVSDSFVALWYARERLESGSLKAYLAAIARNKARDALRSMKLKSALEEDMPIACCEQPEYRALLREMTEAARGAVDSLGDPDGEIFRRHYFLYQKTADIARDMDIKAATVRTKLARGREKLKAYLLERGYDCGNIYL